MNFSLSTATAQASPYFPSIVHTCGSSLHPNLLCQHNNLWPRNGYSNTASSSNVETGGTIASRSALSVGQAGRISIASAVPSKLDEHDPPVRLVQLLRIPKNRISRGCLSVDSLSHAPSKFDIDTSEPKPRGTDNAISCVITYGICSLLPPCFDVGDTTRRKDSSGRAFRPIPFGTGLASPLDPTHRAGVSITD
jgi:hypothetical protein